jgi:hypothetical protein
LADAWRLEAGEAIVMGDAPRVAPARLCEVLPGAVRYDRRDDLSGFTHALDRDLQLVLHWEVPAQVARRVEETVASQLPIVARYRIGWTAQHVERNLERLRGLGMAIALPRPGWPASLSLDVLVVEDPVRHYGYVCDPGGRVRLANLAVRRLADLLASAPEERLAASVTDSVTGFLGAATLLLGPELLDRLLAGTTSQKRVQQEQDLAGAEGWSSLVDLFAVLRTACPYLLLRSRGSVVAARLDELGDIDLLCSDQSVVAAAANAVRTTAKPGSPGHYCQIAGRSLRFDLHAVGDGYYDPRWQAGMLERAQLDADGIVVPRMDDHFFSLLYHVKIHKSAVADHHAATLRELAPQIGLTDLAHDQVREDAAVAQLLGGFLATTGYTVAEPTDRAVRAGLNRRFVAELNQSGSLPPGSVRFGRRQLILRALAGSDIARRLRALPAFRAVVQRLERVLLRLGF